LPAYQAAVARQALSPDGTERLLDVLDLSRRPQVIVQNEADGSRRRLVTVRGATFDPVWSPGGDTVALVSDVTGNDEIYLVARDGSDLRQLTRNTWEWDRSPAWSPNGGQILFYSNRGEGRRQLWVMNADGTGLRNLSSNQHNDWDPVWIK
jgi:TolB protein